MKKTYILPDCSTVSVETASFLTESANEYGNDQGLIKYNSTLVNADDAD